MQQPTERQLEVLAYIRQHIDDEGYSPTFRGIANHFGWSSARAAQDHVWALTRKGKLKKAAGNRGYVPV